MIDLDGTGLGNFAAVWTLSFFFCPEDCIPTLHFLVGLYTSEYRDASLILRDAHP